jgi:acyl-CoA synthetase (NDP forming)
MDDKNIDALIVCIMFASANRPAVRILTDLFVERSINKPILCCFSAPAGIWDGEIKRLEGLRIPNYPTPERAAKTLVHLYRYKKMREENGFF